MSSPEKLIELADALCKEAGASRRAAISRAYYAAFHALQDALDPMMVQDDIGPNGCAQHGAVQHKLIRWKGSHPDKRKAMAHGAEAVQIAHHMQFCREKRERADYQMGPAGEEDMTTAIGVIGKARRIMAFAKKAR